MGVLVLAGSIVVGPAVVSETAFPGAVSTVQLDTTPDQKNSACNSGVKNRTINTPNAFITLSGVGPTDDVTQGDTLYFRSRSPVSVRLTFNNPLVPMSPTVSVIPVNGTLILEAPQSQYLTLLEVQGSGQIEYLVSGQQ